MAERITFTRKVTEEALMSFIREVGAPTIREAKDHFRTGSPPIRSTMGLLLFRNKIIVMGGYGGTIFMMEATGKRGRPNPWAARKAAKATVAKAGLKPQESKQDSAAKNAGAKVSGNKKRAKFDKQQEWLDGKRKRPPFPRPDP